MSAIRRVVFSEGEDDHRTFWGAVPMHPTDAPLTIAVDTLMAESSIASFTVNYTDGTSITFKGES